MLDPTLGYVFLRYRQWPFEGGGFSLNAFSHATLADCAQRDTTCSKPRRLPHRCSATRMEWRSTGNHRCEAHPMRLADLPVLQAMRDRLRKRIGLEHATPENSTAKPSCQRCLVLPLEGEGIRPRMRRCLQPPPVVRRQSRQRYEGPDGAARRRSGIAHRIGRRIARERRMAFNFASPADHLDPGTSGWKPHGCLLSGMATRSASIHALLGAAPVARPV